MRAFDPAIVFLSLAAIVCSADAYRTSRQRVFLCYFASWSYYRVGDGKFSVEQIDATPCTHLIYAYAKPVNGSIAPMDTRLDTNVHKMYRKFNALKRTRRDLKTLISIGGWNEGSERFSKIASSERGRRTFAESVVAFLDLHGFDGIDIDWKYPTQRDGSPNDKKNFALLLKDLRKALDHKDHILTASVSALKAIIDAAYDVKEISRHVHFMSIMGYDLFGPWNYHTGHPAPLRGRTGGSSDESTLNVETSVESWISKGADVGKLVLGMPLYGRTYTLKDPNEHGFNAPTWGPGESGPFTREPGLLGYNEICTLISTGGWKVTRDPNVNAPVAVKGNLWIGFDDAESLANKVQLALDKGLAGAMVWSIETDDFRGKCGRGKNPLQEAIRKALLLNASEPETTSEPTMTTSDPTMTTPEPTMTTSQHLTRSPVTNSPGLFKCVSEDRFPDPNTDTGYIWCVRRGSDFQLFKMRCPRGTFFRKHTRRCDHVYKNAL
uniref:Putative chitinase n=1 Tax=Ixodes scapularis TaxID=6945 RepID=A0A4D5S383_IXOSC